MMSKIKQYIIKLYWKKWKNKSEKQYPNTAKNIIVFESRPDLSDNTKAVFDEMIKRGFNNKYKMVWLISAKEIDNRKKIKNVYYHYLRGIEGTYYEKVSKLKISCNYFIPRHNEKQFSIYLSHGTAVKSVREYYNVPDGIDYMISASKDVISMQSYELNFDRKRIVPLGFPRNDVFSKPSKNIKQLLNTNCKKVIIWYPTYRQRNNSSVSLTTNAIPILHDSESSEKLNDMAVANDVLIVIKTHFAQNVTYIKKLNLSNIKFIDDSFFAQNQISSYEFVGASDALITDYSSIYYDYTLCNKPIAAIWEDIEEYKQNPGLVNEYEWLMKGAEKIYNIDDFCEFINRISEGVDVLKIEREEIRDYANISTDGKNSERVVDFIEALLKKGKNK